MLSGPAWGRTKRRAMRDGMAKDLHEAALAYHRLPKPGKLEISATKPLANQRDLALAYSPGVAAACDAIVADPAEAYNLTARGNLVARSEESRGGKGGVSRCGSRVVPDH